MRSKRYSNHPTITVLVQGVYASVFVHKGHSVQFSSFPIMGACLSCCVSDEGPDASAYRAGSSLRYVRHRAQMADSAGRRTAAKRNETYDQLFSCSPVLHARNARNALTRPGFPLRRSPGAQTEADRAARAAAAEAAAARQERFETSAVGKAVKKSVKASKERPTAGRESAPISDYIS